MILMYSLGVRRDNSPASVESGKNDSLARTNSWQWTYRSQVGVPLEVLTAAAVPYQQDEHLADGSVLTEFDYSTAVLHKATLYTNGTSHVSVFDRNDRRISEFSYAKYAAGVPVKRKIPICRFLTGTTLTLYGNVENTTGNIGHWVVDGISQLFLATKHHAISDIDFFLVPVLRYDFQRESLVQLGIPIEKIIELDTLECVQCERLIATSAPRGFSSCVTPGWMIDGYREALLPSNTQIKAGKRIYISRRDAGSRKFVNEEDIILCLKEFGFDVVEMTNYSFAEKIALFSDAEMIVGLTGAGLTNCMFCHRQASVIELFPASYVTYFYASMCGYLGVDFDYIIFENNSLLSSMNKYYGNYPWI